MEIFRSFLDFLRTDPQFYYETGEELLAAYRAMAKKIDAYMPTLFNKFPRAPYGVIEIPMETAPYTTTAYYNSPSAGNTVIFMQIYINQKLDLNMKFQF